jgi:short-subunit dehydrogenase
MIAVNFRGAMLALKLGVPRMLARGRGQVLVVDSASAKLPVPGAATYSATKHAVYGMADALDVELRASPVDITLVLPTVVETELTRGLKHHTIGIPTLKPDQVARAIVGAIERPRFEVYVPRTLRPTFGLAAIMPRRAAKLVARLAKSDQVLMDVDSGARAGYEAEFLGGESGSR